MKRERALASIVGMLIFCCAALDAQAPPPPGQSRQALIELEREWLKAPSVETLNRILADDFVHVLPFGFVTKVQEIDYARRHGGASDGRERRFESLSVRIYGAAGVVNGVVTASDGKGKVVSRTRFTDVFAYRNGRWQAVNAQELPVSVRQ